MIKKISKTEEIVLGGGCFWCLDAVYSRIKGVEDVIAGYAGGWLMSPTYEQVCSSETGHAEVVKLAFDPDAISLDDILHIFFLIHDPTTADRQGNDVGPQYRSIILYANEKQKETAEKVIQEITMQKAYENPIVTEVVPLESFFGAEEYHQKYFEKNPEKAYCQIIIAPKIAKMREKYKDLYKN
ncbi:MAG TPA: peptide-methionine (S)-S-oxide reductase MsrA [Patescibacteria group bacterium]